MPLFEVTQNPASNLRLHSLLPLISGIKSYYLQFLIDFINEFQGFDSVDDESYVNEKALDPYPFIIYHKILSIVIFMYFPSL